MSCPVPGNPNCSSEKSKRGGSIQDLAAFAHLGMMFPISIALGTLVGFLLDRGLGTSPAFALVGFGLGVAAAVIELFRTVARESQQHSDGEERRGKIGDATQPRGRKR